LNRFLILPVFHLLLDFSIGIHVCIEDLPLGRLKGEVGLDGRVSLDTALLQGEVESLTGTLLEVELVTDRFLLGTLIAIDYIN
jgi:hypothetical protein